ncbi:PD-(D/E)XK nuclease family protein [Sphingobacterium sp. HJSM2_6]|uniref:PD-(D/E)XK nuclease family protein n=1 Tax=Sphingobacterium sp. HJSM2_6 TaxID=3366264 RepID=UPI003BD92A6F
MKQPFLRIIAEHIQQLFGSELADIAIVFNNKRPITYLKKHLVDVYQQALWSPQFFTIQEFLAKSTSKTQASPLSQFFYLYELHNDLLMQEGLEPESLEEFYPIAEIILSDFNQLDYDLVPIDQVFLELNDQMEIDLAFQHFTEEQLYFIKQFWQTFSQQGHSAVQQRFLKLWRRLPKLYQAFKEKLAAEKQTNHASIYRELAEGRAENNEFINDYKKVLFIGFNALNKAEATLFKSWQEQEKALFYFDADRHYTEDNMQEAGLFIRKNCYQTGLVNALGPFQDHIASQTTDVHLYQCLGKNSETKLLYDILSNNRPLLEDPTKTTAILLADESLLVSLLQSLPAYHVNITTGYPLIQSPIYGFIDLWMEVQVQISQYKKDKIPYTLLETFIAHPLARMSAIQQKNIQKEIAEKQLFEVPLQDIRIESSCVPYYFQAIIQEDQVVSMLLQIVEDLLQAIQSQEGINRIEVDLLIELRKVLLQLQLGFERLQRLSIGFQIGLIRKAIAPINSAIQGNPLEGIQIMGLLESRCLNFDQVYILGANEGILPKIAGSPTFLPNNLRKAYQLPVLENQDALSAYLFYRHFQYSPNIHLFYNGIIDENSTGEESRFIKQLEFETNFNFIHHVQQQPLLFPAQPDELIIEKKEEVWNALYSKYIVQGKSLSASAFTTYLSSPIQFFIKYVAEIKEPPTVSQEFEMNKLGTIIHECMEHLLTPLVGLEDFTETAIFKSKIELVDQLVLQEIAKVYSSDIQTLNDLNSLQRIMHKIASEYVKLYLSYDIEEYQAIRIIELENSEDYYLNFDLQIEGKTEKIKLFGIIDRVDEVITKDGEHKMRIVDYKTGADEVLFSNLDAVFSENTSNKALLQTLFYAYVYEQVKGISGLEPHLYVARRMREDGTIFRNKSGNMVFTDENLSAQKIRFVDFLKTQLEDLFNPNKPFKHHPDARVYPSDPYQLFYKYSLEHKTDEEVD